MSSNQLEHKTNSHNSLRCRERERERDVCVQLNTTTAKSGQQGK